MPSFFTLSFVATLAFAALIVAVPTVVAPAVDLEIRADCVGQCLLKNLSSALSDATADIKTTSDVPTLSNGLNTALAAIQGVSNQIKANPATALQGLDVGDCVGLLGQIISILAPILSLITGLIQGGSLSGSDCDLLGSLVTTILNLLGELICLVVSLVPTLGVVSSLLSILDILGGLTGGILNTLISLVISLISPDCSSILGGLGPIISGSGLGGLLGIFGCGDSYPTALGGTLSILQFVTSILTNLLPGLLSGGLLGL